MSPRQLGGELVASLLASYWLWYGIPAAFITGEAVTEVGGGFLAGLVIAKILKPPFGAIAPAS